jgi:hypothetical protein
LSGKSGIDRLYKHQSNYAVHEVPMEGEWHADNDKSGYEIPRHPKRHVHYLRFRIGYVQSLRYGFLRYAHDQLPSYAGLRLGQSLHGFLGFVQWKQKSAQWLCNARQQLLEISMEGKQRCGRHLAHAYLSR